MLRILITVSLPLAGAVALGAHALVHLVWVGRWDRSAPVVSVIVWSLPAWIGFQIVRALLEARGLWAPRLVILGIYGLGSCAVVAIAAATTHGLDELALALSAFYVAFGLALLAMLPALIGVSLREVVGVLVKPLVACACCALLGLAVTRTAWGGSGSILADATGVLVFAAAGAVTNWLWFQAEWRSALGTFVTARAGGAQGL
jgi:hypothetical protein